MADEYETKAEAAFDRDEQIINLLALEPGEEAGIAKATASNEHFLNTCAAVKRFITIEHEGRELFAFAYDPLVEVSLVPATVRFEFDYETEFEQEVSRG